ncbi:UNVERIFIED_CONTAM: hypothetical protein PYX00_005353 [Menopon gallinae]|uniref:ABC transporter domain-containing protein n=1 Tax=Menopon gallinae TaxID=328185 RepID=A0AAW2HQZ2_9NEOP
MLDIHEGVIKIDGLDISKIPLNILRTSGSIIPQDTLLFNGTIRENLDPSGVSTDEQLWSALEQAHLKDVDSEINAGQYLSGGQKQLFSLARAILQKSCFLIMDEATSNLDKEFEQILMSTAQKLFHGKTLLIIAHRLSTVLDCDRIIVLDRGRIVEDGSPSILLNRNCGIFSAMVKSSEEGFLVP